MIVVITVFFMTFSAIHSDTTCMSASFFFLLFVHANGSTNL